MDRIVEPEEVWAASLEDRPGALANKLSGLAESGADLDFIVARRSAEKSGTGVVFVTPLRGDREVRAATALGFSVTNSMHSVCVDGPNEPGVAAKITRTVAQAGVNLRGLLAAVIGTRVVVHLAFDEAADAQKVIRLLQ